MIRKFAQLNPFISLIVHERNAQPDCPTFTPAFTTTLPTTTTPQVVFDLVASPLYKSYTCLGNQTTILIPNDYQLFPLRVYYGVSKDYYTCKINSATDCQSPAQLTCSLQGSCTISLYNDIPISGCSDSSLSIANYIGLEYRFIPCNTITITNTSKFN